MDCFCDLRCEPMQPSCSCACHDAEREAERLFPTKKVPALYVAENGPYAKDPRFDAWGITRNAMNYDGEDAGVWHTMCQRFGRFSRGSPTHQRFQVGDDGGHMAHSVDHIRRRGGVLEQPQGSKAFEIFGLPIPPKRGWSAPDQYGGRSCYIDQGAYGHPAKKPTWFYAVLPFYPKMDWTRVKGRPYIGGDGFHSSRERARAKATGRYKPKEQIPREWNWRTPERLKDALYEMAASCEGWQPEKKTLQVVLGG